jgi:hypothetical protein
LPDDRQRVVPFHLEIGCFVVASGRQVVGARLLFPGPQVVDADVLDGLHCKGSGVDDGVQRLAHVPETEEGFLDGVLGVFLVLHEPERGEVEFAPQGKDVRLKVF